MRAIHVDNDASVRLLRVSRFDPREGDIQIASPNRLSLFSYLVPYDVRDRSQHLRNSNEIG